MSTKSKSFLSQAAIFLVYAPILITALGYVLAFLIPGCPMPSEKGAAGCVLAGFNFNPLFDIIGFWGQIYLALGIGIFVLIVLPAWFISALWTDSRKK